jgi:mono/diheme cytochrome c family protein
VRLEPRSLLFVFLGLTATASAQGPSNGFPTNDTERLGQRLFNQSCIVCHGNVDDVVATAPVLTKNTFGGDLTALKELISNGTALASGRMPAWRYRFTADEINAIAMYIKTIVPGTASALPSGAAARRAPSP